MDSQRVFHCNVQRPELTEEECGLVRAMIEEIDTHGGGMPAWEN